MTNPLFVSNCVTRSKPKDLRNAELTFLFRPLAGRCPASSLHKLRSRKLVLNSSLVT